MPPFSFGAEVSEGAANAVVNGFRNVGAALDYYLLEDVALDRGEHLGRHNTAPTVALPDPVDGSMVYDRYEPARGARSV